MRSRSFAPDERQAQLSMAQQLLEPIQSTVVFGAKNAPSLLEPSLAVFIKLAK